MKALVYQGIGKTEVKDIPQPKPEKGEVLLKPLYVGLCFSDRHAYENGFPLYTPGVVLGHEVSTVVAEVGPAVQGWKAGDRVALDPRTYCGECIMCRAGFYTQCQKIAGWIGINSRRNSGELYHGALAEYCAVPAYTCFYEISSFAAEQRRGSHLVPRAILTAITQSLNSGLAPL